MASVIIDVSFLNGVQVNGVHYSGGVPDVQSPPSRNTREDVLDAAMRVLDDEGLPGLTMRRLAHDLGVRPSALYWHVADKQTLLAALSERILAPVRDLSAFPDAPDPSWEQALSRAAQSVHDALVAHRDGAEVVSSSLALGLVHLPLADVIEAPLRAAGASRGTVAAVADTLGHYVIGRTFHDQQRENARRAGLTVEPVTPPTGLDRGVALVVAGTGVLLALDTDGARVASQDRPGQ